jgi:hypothetical protein
MEPQATVTVAPTGDLPSELAQLCRTAASILDSHVDDHGLCAVCESAWPCERAVLAEHNLAGL